MPVKRDIVEFLMNGGVDTKTDEKFVSPPKALDIQNGIFTKHRTLRTRDGYSKLGNRDDSDDKLREMRQLTHLGNELIGMTKDTLYSYSEALDAWVDQGRLPLFSMSTQTISDEPTDQQDAVSATNGELRVTVWTDNDSSDLQYRVTDEVTGAALTSAAALHANGVRPLAINTGIGVLVSCIDSTTDAIQLYFFSKSNVSGFHTDMNNNINTDYVYDMTYDDSNGYVVVAYKGVTATDLIINFRATNGIAHPSNVPVTYDATPWGTDIVFASMHNNPSDFSNDGVTLFWGTDTDLIHSHVDDGGLPSPQARRILQDAATRGTCIPTGINNQMRFIWQDSSNIIWTATRANATTSGDSSTAVELCRGCTLYAKAVRYADSDASLNASAGFTAKEEWVVPLAYSSPEGYQDTLLFMDVNGNAVSRANIGVNNGAWPNAVLPEPQFLSGVATMAINPKRRVRVSEEQADGYTQAGIEILTIDPSIDYTSSAEMADSLWIGGSAIWQYDGDNVVEAGFWFYPEIDLTQWDDDGGGPGSGAVAVSGQPFSLDFSAHGTYNGSNTYIYYICYEWYDYQGRRCQSFALPFTVQNLADPGSVNFPVDVPALPYSKKTDVRIAVYRTAEDDSDGLAYRITPYPSTYLAQNATNADVPITDSKADADLKVGEHYYQSLGLIDNVAPVATDAIIEFDDRIAYVNAFDRAVVQVSDRPPSIEQPHFADDQRVLVPDSGGDVTALGVMDRVLVVFKRDRIYAVEGAGPNNAGAGSYSVPRLVSTDTGCKDQRSVVRTPHGLMFQSDKGIYLLGRDFQVSYVGSDVEGYNSSTIRASTLIPDDNGVVFLTNDDRTLYFDYEHASWSTWVNHAGLSAVALNDDYYYLRNDGFTVYKKDTTLTTDDGSAIQLVYETPWYRPAGAQRLFRCIQMNLLGNYLSDHELKIKVYVNYREYPQYSTTWDVSDGLDQGTWGGKGTWGGGDAWGIDDETKLDRVYQVEHRPKIQKVQAIKFRFSTESSSPPGRNVEFSAIALDVGMYRGSFRLPSGKQT